MQLKTNLEKSVCKILSSATEILSRIRQITWIKDSQIITKYAFCIHQVPEGI